MLLRIQCATEQHQRTCDSVLSPKQIQLVSQFDTKAKGDVGPAWPCLCWQDPQLLWAKPGFVKFRKQLKKLKQEPKENEPVGSEFFENNLDVHKEGIGEGWFREEKDPEQSTSLAQLGHTTCDESTLEQIENKSHCPPPTWQNAKKACFEDTFSSSGSRLSWHFAKKWQISAKPNEKDF